MGEAGLKGDVAELAIALEEQPARVLEPSLQDVAVHGDAHGRLEPRPQVRAADAGLAAENVHGERPVQILVNIGRNSVELRLGETRGLTRRIICQPKQLDCQGHSDILGEQGAARRARLDVTFERLSSRMMRSFRSI
jgi:hypothetical protein